MNNTLLGKSIINLKGIGPKKGEILKNEASIESIEDLLYYIPRKFLDRSQFKNIADCLLNEEVTVSGEITHIGIAGYKRKFLEVKISDGTDNLTGVFFGGRRFFQRIFNIGDSVIFSGKITFYQKKQIVHPDFDFIDISLNKEAINTGRIIPLYKSTESLKGAGFDSRGFRKIIHSALDLYLKEVKESLPPYILKKYNLMTIDKALFAIHFPESFEDADNARKRLAFNEVFFLQIYLHLSKKYVSAGYEKKRSVNSYLYEKLISDLPFTLTVDQLFVIKEIEGDLKNPMPMNRLLQGDVGSGKTIVAVAVALFAIGNKRQVALMAPTEVLAFQHYDSIKKFIPEGVSIFLLTGSMKKKEKEVIYRDSLDGNIDLLIGTHAVIQSGLEFNNLGLVIIDEQHRFGVEQRARLREKGNDPDFLVMTATPIPRSLAMTLYGDMSISYLRSKPGNRIPVKTLSYPESKLKSIYNSLEKYIGQGRQIFYILPLIEESEKIDLKSAIEVYEKLKNDILSHRRIEILHGRLKSSEKADIMNRFAGGDIDLLVSTTVVEVGIDIPNANVILIEHAERFGLSQLHQLRGRVGRGDYQSYCILLYPDKISDESKKRIDVMVETDDGFIISEEDLKIRGAGDFFGTRQHGYSNFEFADILNDGDLILNAKSEAEIIVDEIDDIERVMESFENKHYLPIIEGIRKKRIFSILS
jgi:ATP-dependent DNA helicase RecG